jgi:hypothetical protein
VVGLSSNGLAGVVGMCTGQYGVSGLGRQGGVHGEGGYSGVHGENDSTIGVLGTSKTNIGIYGASVSGIGVDGLSDIYIGVRGMSNSNFGVHGYSEKSYGVYAFSNEGIGLFAGGREGYAARFEGEVNMTSTVHMGGTVYTHGPVYISGPLSKPSGQFKIDHPLDPKNKYLQHSFVESPDMKNIYDGVVALDEKGEAEVVLPDWFGALNKDFRYQLTAIGAPGPNLYISKEISEEVLTDSNGGCSYCNNRFKISGGTEGMKVSWNVTGIRKDPWANAHRIQVEEDKTDKERGYYLYPELYSQPEEMQIAPFTSPEEQEVFVKERPRSKTRKKG